LYSISSAHVVEAGSSKRRSSLEAALSARSAEAGAVRPRASGKFLYVGEGKFWVRGVSYGTFRPDDRGCEYPRPDVVEQDFAQIAAAGLNTVRTYTVPPRWLLDAAQRQGLRLMVGIPWEEHITFLDDRKRAKDIIERVRRGVRACAGHPAVFCYSIGNEIPASVVRWHGRRCVERYIERLFRAAKAEDPGALITYVNYPTTEYLQLPFLDILSFNVYLESQAPLEAYLARLHNIAGDRPLLLTEIGLDSRRHGEEAQARALDWQVRTAFASGCAGAMVFSWTDEWHRGGCDIEDWDFGLTGRNRRPKPALAAVRKAFAEVPFPAHVDWPRISVVVCTHNGSRTIHQCCEELRKLDYPNFEVIVVDDGSTDRTAAIVQQSGFRSIRTENRGLSNARNVGLGAATGEIVAYLDDDAFPDPHWLTHLAATFLRTPHAGVGGPNIPPGDDGWIADCVANAPGGPVHVLLSDCEAEHIPGCNMAFRKNALQAIGGFDQQFRVAGDDVDVCWRLQHQGWTLGVNPAAVVFHHRRNSVWAYWKQQIGYGKAEALLERKWPEKYNAAGHPRWSGRTYGCRGPVASLWNRGRIYQGTWGSAPYQALYQPPHDLASALPLMPEWYLVVFALGLVSAMGMLWRPLLFAAPLLALVLGAPIAQALLAAGQATFGGAPSSNVARLKRRGLTFVLHLLQPIARLCGRLRNGLHPWRQRAAVEVALPHARTCSLWRERWQSGDETLRSLETAARASGAIVVPGGAYDRWDLEIQGGLLGNVRARMVIEEHGAGKQLVRFRSWPRGSMVGGGVALMLAFGSIAGALDRAWTAGVVLGILALVLGGAIVRDCAVATATLLRALRQLYPEAAVSFPESQKTGPRRLFSFRAWHRLGRTEGTCEAEKTV
jgi:O-antigen biosynthesis protein